MYLNMSQNSGFLACSQPIVNKFHMAITLGLDIGANSIGWAVINSNQQTIEGMGVRVFPAGVNQYNTTKEETKNQSRRAARGLRRQYARRRLRKVKLVEFLNRYGLTPFTPTDINEWKKCRDLPVKPHLSAWFEQSPYELRAKAIKAILLPHELGRVFYHMVQRRGFLSNRKSGSSDEDGAIFEGKKESGTTGIIETQTALSEYDTLGEYLNSLNPHENRIRNRYTERRMYVQEAKKILDRQSLYYDWIDEAFVSELLGSDTQKNMNGVLFWQRPLKSSRHLLGKCPFEKTKTRIPMAAFEFEEFRVWSWVNTVSYLGEALNQVQRELLAEILFTTKDKVSFSAMKKKLGFQKTDENFNYADDDKIQGAKVTAAFREALGTDWARWTDSNKDLLWHDVISATDDEWLVNRLSNRWALTEKQQAPLKKLRIKPDYGSLSKKAIRNILPFLKMGFMYDRAVLFGGIKNVFGKDWDTLADKDAIIDTISGFRGSSMDGSVHEQVRAMLTSHYGKSESDLRKLYHHSQIEDLEELLPELPKPDPIKNPVVMQALFEVRKLVNALIQRFGTFDAIHIELARDLGKSKDKRSEDRTFQKQNEELNDKIALRLRAMDLPESYDFKLRLKLYEELKDKVCPYSGKTIRLAKTSSSEGLGLFSGQVQIEHIIPYSRSLTNAFGNLTLCDADVNRAKGNKTPFEFYSEQGAWEDAKLRARNVLPYKKFLRFTQTELDEDPINRMLNDTRYMTRETHRYLKMICANVVPVNGALTSDVRHHWGLNTLLNEEDYKNRNDHRHHALDALVVALTNRSMVRAASDWNKYNRDSGTKTIPAPWPELRAQADRQLDQILVSHKKTNRVLTVKESKTKRDGVVHRNKGLAARGALHKETIFGKRQGPDGGYAYHVRKPIGTVLTMKQLHEVVDPMVREAMIGVLRDKGLSTDLKASIPKDAFTYMDENGRLRTRVFLKDGTVGLRPVFKVRMRKELGNAAQLVDGKGQFVNPQNNHHVALYQTPEGGLEEECVTFWDVVERKKQGQPAILPTNVKGNPLVETLQINDLFLIGWTGDPSSINQVNQRDFKSFLFRVQSLSSKDYWFTHHLVSNSADESAIFIRFKSMKAWKERKPIKVWLTVDGRIEPFRRT